MNPMSKYIYTVTVTLAPAAKPAAPVAKPAAPVAKPAAPVAEAEAITWVREQDEDSELDQQELEAAFHALYGREPDADDRQAGLWSLCCAATPGM